MMSINAVKAWRSAQASPALRKRRTEHSDEMTPEGYLSNNAGGILGGISSGQDVVVSIAIKPTSSIRLARRNGRQAGSRAKIETHGRHDPCVGIRATPIAEAMLALTLMDHALRHQRPERGRDPARTPRIASRAPQDLIDRLRAPAAVENPEPTKLEPACSGRGGRCVRTTFERAARSDERDAMSALLHARLAGFYFFYFAYLGAFARYFSLYLASLEFNATRDCPLLALPAVMRIFAPYLWGMLADRSGQRVRVALLAGVAGNRQLSRRVRIVRVVVALACIALWSFFWSAALAAVGGRPRSIMSISAAPITGAFACGARSASLRPSSVWVGCSISAASTACWGSLRLQCSASRCAAPWCPRPITMAMLRTMSRSAVILPPPRSDRIDRGVLSDGRRARAVLHVSFRFILPPLSTASRRSGRCGRSECSRRLRFCVHAEAQTAASRRQTCSRRVSL
jgi:hypothetical protein